MDDYYGRYFFTLAALAFAEITLLSIYSATYPRMAFYSCIKLDPLASSAYLLG